MTTFYLPIPPPKNSSNGTFVRGEKIGKYSIPFQDVYISVISRHCVGKGKTSVLNNDDEIALSLKKNKGTGSYKVLPFSVCVYCGVCIPL